ncbi:uncharacterized protein LOC132619638 [Lycium barbarum]|uniref:uncharacterized protein LOC132619638 n=1 Tax=Lycium barbarum TaxID=112863 RepID=UPI00293E632B|nr:uncharacterized protein LOC132619638 [Lycium barbarum]
MEREARAKADENVAKKIRSLKEAVRSIQPHKGCEGLEYKDLCIHPDIELPTGYKVPKFDMFDGKVNPRAHLRSYCDNLVGVGKDQAISMKLFIRCLMGEALDWYTCQDPQKWHSWGEMAQEFMDRFRFNIETVPYRFYLMKLERKSIETFREYDMRWKAKAAKVQPPMAESEMTTLFVQPLKDATYYERLISVIGQKYSEVIKMGDFIEEGIKIGKVTNLAALQEISKSDEKDKAKGKFIVEIVATGLTRSGRCYAPEKVARATPSKENGQKKAVTEAEVEEFWRKMTTKEYSLVEQLKKTLAQISLLALLISS